MKFEQYLQEKFSEQYRGLDDDMVDAECDWMEALGIDEVIEYAEMWNAEDDEIYIKSKQIKLLSFRADKIKDLEAKVDKLEEENKDFLDQITDLVLDVESLEAKIELAKEGLRKIKEDRLYSDCSMSENYGYEYEEIAKQTLEKLKEEV